MSRLLVFVGMAFFLSFSGCASKSVAAESNAPVEKEVSAYLVGDYVDVDTAKAKLVEAGFNVVATYEVDKKGDLTTIIFTSDSMKAAADKPTRGFAAILRLLVDNERHHVSITNPVYFGKAFLQDDYNHQTAVSLRDSLTKVFGALSGSTDKWEFDALADYHFMMGMPYYADVTVLGEGDNKELIDKAMKYKNGKEAIFELKLSESRTLVGYALSSRTSKFVDKIGTQNASVLPYVILIEDGKAKALAAKYYIAVSYPLLTMSEFMTIATIPGAIEKELSKPFK